MTLTHPKMDKIDLDQRPAHAPATPAKEVDTHVGRNLRNARNLRGLTQRQLGVSVNLTLQQIQKYENASNRITVSRLHQFSEVLNVPVGQFFSGPAQDTELAAEESGLNFSADDFEILSLTARINPRLKRRIICLMEEMAVATATPIILE